MNTFNYSTFRARLVKLMGQVYSNHLLVIITRKRQAPVVMISLEDYQALEETLYLLGSPANAWRLLESIAELETGKGATR